MGKIKKVIFITGANGFIGRNLKEYLSADYRLLTPSRRELNLLNEREVDGYFKKNRIDVVIHCAVVGGSRKEEQVSSSLSDNLRMFFNIVKNRDKFKKMIHFGSGAEYDKSRPIIRVRETEFGKAIPHDEYGFYKYICSKYIENNPHNNIACLRIFGLFGKHEDYRYRFISSAIVSQLKGLPIEINKNVFFDYVFIEDFIKIVRYFINHNAKHSFYNIGTGKQIDLLSIAKKINEIVDKKTRIRVKHKGLNNEYSCNNGRLLKEMKNMKFEPFILSLKKLYSWYQKNE